MGQFHKLKVKEIQHITLNAVTIFFDVPENLKNEFQFTAGQYITIKKEIEGKELRRDYSICSSPKSGEIRVGVKKVEGGSFSNYANTELQEGDILEVHTPNGRFTLKPDSSKSRNIAAFVAGSGITPVMSIMQAVLESEPNSNFVLVYGNKSVSETMFNDEILKLISKYENRLKVYFIYSKEQVGDSLFGRIERSTVNFVIKNKHKDVDFDAFYLCGPEKMINSVSETLQETGVDKNNIHYELFTTASAKETETVDIPKGKTKVKIMLDDEEVDFVMDKKQLILDVALSQKLDAPYSCQGGICSSCIARLKEGKVEMVKNQILTDSELAEGFILTCQSHPVTNTIYVDYDDV